MKLIIEEDDEGRVQVWRDGYTTGFLTLGEALETVINHIKLRAPMYPMHTPEEWEKPWKERGAPANFDTPATKETTQ